MTQRPYQLRALHHDAKRVRLAADKRAAGVSLLKKIRTYLKDSNMTVVIVGPQGCGKTYYAQDLARFYECTTIVDRGGIPFCAATKWPNLGATMVLTDDVHPSWRTAQGVVVIDFYTACAAAGINPETKFQASRKMQAA